MAQVIPSIQKKVIIIVAFYKTKKFKNLQFAGKKFLLVFYHSTIDVKSEKRIAKVKREKIEFFTLCPPEKNEKFSLVVVAQTYNYI